MNNIINDTAAKATGAQLIEEVSFEQMNIGDAKNAELTKMPGPLFLKMYNCEEAVVQLPSQL